MRIKVLPFLFHALLLFYISFLIVKPVLHNTAITPTGTTYTFQHRILEDYYFYIMVIRQGRDALREYDQYTTETTGPTAMHIYYLLLGAIGKLAGLSNIVMYYAGALAGLVIFYIFSWKLACLLFPNIYKYVAMLLFFVASPFPDTNVTLFGLTIPLGTSWWTNMDPYARLTQVPHHAVGQGLMLAATYFSLLFFLKRKFIWSLAASGTIVLGIFFYSVPMLTFLLAGSVTIALYEIKSLVQAIRRRSLLAFAKKHEKHLLGLGIMAGVAAISVFFVQSIIAGSGWPWSTFLAWEANWYNHKTEIYPYTIGLYLISFGLLPIFILPAVLTIMKERRPAWVFIFVLFLCPIMLYLGAAKHLYLLPKIRFVHSAPYVFAGLLATGGIQTILNVIRQKPVKAIIAAFIAAAFLIGTITGLRSYWLPELSKYDTFYNTYIPNDYFRIIGYLNQYSRPFSSVFASYAVGTYLPSFTKNNVYVGHMVSTNNFWSKYSTANSFFKYQITENDALSLLRENNISYVLGEEPGLTAAYKHILQPVYSAGNLTLYTPVYEAK